MKHISTAQVPMSNLKNKHQRPENKDNLDSREGEEQEFKGDDVTHNHKETKEKKDSITKQPFIVMF